MRLEIRRRSRWENKKLKLICFCMLLACLVICVLLFIFRVGRSQMLREVAQSELESIAYDIVGNVVQEELLRGEVEYCEFVHIERDVNGKISAISTDMKKINLLKLRVANRLSDEMFVRTEDVIKIPFGNLTGIDFLTGAGPDVKFKILWVSSVNSDFSNSFESAGINQTVHRVMLDFSLNVGMMFVGREIGVDVGTSVCVAETVIVGEVPKYFSEK